MLYRTFPKLPFPSTIRKLKSESFIRSLLPLLSNLEMAFVVFSSAALDPVPILALCTDGDGTGRKEKKLLKTLWRKVIIKPDSAPEIPR